MPTFEVMLPGTLYRRWPASEEIRLADCVFNQGNNPREFFVHTEVEARSDDAARQIGREKCLDAVNLLEFCMKEQVDLWTNQDQVREKEAVVSTGSASISAVVPLVAEAPPTAEQMIAINTAQTTIGAETDEERREGLLRAIHWQARGRREAQSKIDRFIKCWMALEVLSGGAWKKVVVNVRDQLIQLYPEVESQRVESVVQGLYGIRGNIVHSGVREPRNLQTRLEQLEAVVADLLRARLGLTSAALSECFFS